MRCKIVEVLGDYYYKEMGIEETMDIVFKKMPAEKLIKSQDDLDMMVAGTINERFSLDRP